MASCPPRRNWGRWKRRCGGERRLRKPKRQVSACKSVSLEPPIYHRSFGLYKTVDECLSSKSARVIRCPKCDSWLCNGSWLKVKERYIARSRCLEHGRFYTCVTIHQSPLGARGNMDLFSPETFSPELYRLRKLGGKTITIRSSASAPASASAR